MCVEFLVVSHVSIFNCPIVCQCFFFKFNTDAASNLDGSARFIPRASWQLAAVLKILVLTLKTNKIKLIERLQ